MVYERNALWVDLSAALFRQVIPFNVRDDFSGMTQAEHAFLAHKESRRVDEALVAMALSAGEQEVNSIVSTLQKDTVLALASRWAIFLDLAKAKASDPSFQLWFSPGDRDTWRVILLSLLQDRPAAEGHLRSLWGAAFPGFQG
jgi:hypothetical protein